MIHIDASSFENLIKSYSNLFNCSEDIIKKYLFENRNIQNTNIENINIEKFVKYCGIECENKSEIFEMIKFDTITLFHLTSRIENPTCENFYNLHDSLILDTDIRRFMIEHDFDFIASSEKIDVFYKNKILNFDLTNEPVELMLRKRGKKFGKYVDYCINGFLINEEIYLDSDVTHILGIPEYLENLARYVKRSDVVDDWKSRSKAYIIGYSVNIQEIIYDNNSSYRTVKSKILLTHKYFINYMIKKFWNNWDSRFDNHKLRLKDTKSINSSLLNFISELDTF